MYLFLTDLVIAAVLLPLLCFLSMEFWLHPCLLWSMKSHLQYCWHVSYNVFPSAPQRHYQRGLYLREIKIFWWSLLIEADEQNFKISFYVWPWRIKEQYIPWWLNIINLHTLSCWFFLSLLNLIRLLCICVKKLIENEGAAHPCGPAGTVSTSDPALPLPRSPVPHPQQAPGAGPFWECAIGCFGHVRQLWDWYFSKAFSLVQIFCSVPPEVWFIT